MIENIKEILKGPLIFQFFHLSEKECFSTDSSYTVFKVEKIKTFTKDLFMDRKQLREVSTIITPKTKIEIKNQNLVLTTTYLIKTYPLLSQKIKNDLTSIREVIPTIEKYLTLSENSSWLSIQEDLDLLPPFNEGLLLEIQKDKIKISTPVGSGSSFSLDLPINFDLSFYNKSYKCNSIFLKLLKDSTHISLMQDKNNKTWLVLKKEEIQTYLLLKDSASYHTVYTNFDPLSFL